MHNNHIPFKVAVGYAVIAIILFLAIALVYSNTTSIIAINQASREYIQKREMADSTMSRLLKDGQINLKQLSDAMERKSSKSYLRAKVDSLNKGKDSILVHTKSPQTHEAKNTTVEVVKSKKGFFRRLADAFRKEHAETLRVTKDSNQAVIDSIATPVNVAENVADILEEIDKKEKKASKDHNAAVSKEMDDLRMVNAQLALRTAKEISDTHQRERSSMQDAINKAMEARQHLLWQIALLALVAIIAAIILIWYIARDTKKERIYREKLEDANEEIQRIMNQRERLLLTITHDIKAPAASISGFIDLMKDYVNDKRGRSCLQNIQDSAHHLSKLVASLLDYHQLENGLMEVHPVTFSPILLVKQSVEGLRLQAEQKGLQLTFDWQMPDKKSSTELVNTDNTTPSSIPPIADALYKADAFRIRQILDNLISNAIKYTDRGSIQVIASMIALKKTYTTSDKDNYLLTLAVKDTGKGMTTEECQKVFQAFTRLKSAQGIEGTGLGLSITHELVALLGGEIHLRSEVGKGSTFTVSIPLTPTTEEENATETAEKKENNQIDTSVESWHEHIKSDSVNQEKTKKLFTNHKLLILDDDKLQLQLLQEMLRRLVGDTWQVFACNHVSEALTILHNEHPTLMMMDIEMPEMNGMQMIKHINHHNMTVIAMTAHDASIKEELWQAGFDDCLFKPFRMESLAELLGMEIKKYSLTEEKENSLTEKTDNSNTNDKKPLTTDKQHRFQPLLTFAEGDKEAEAEILQTVKSELEGYCQGLAKELKAPFNQEDTSSTPKSSSFNLKNIGKIAHKLLPIASMLQMQSIESIKALSPEHIMELNSATTHIYMQEALGELRGILAEISVP